MAITFFPSEPRPRRLEAQPQSSPKQITSGAQAPLNNDFSATCDRRVVPIRHLLLTQTKGATTMSRKSLLLIAAAVISAPALVSTNAFAKGAAAAHSAVSRPHVSTLGAVGRVAVPRAKVYGTPGPGSKKNASGSNPTMVQKALDAARAQQQKALQDAAKTSNPTMVQKALDAARAQQEKALQDAKASNPTMFQKALDAARAQQKAAEDAIR